MKRIFKVFACGVFIFSLCACDQGMEKERAKESAPSAEIFHDHKQLRLGDSLHIRVLSWGGELTGSYLVLIADTINQHFIGDSYFRQGNLKDAWVDDLDKDGFPEVGVMLQEPEDLQYGRLAVHELLQDFTLRTSTFPPLPEALGAAYGGGDSVYIGNDKVIVREFHLIDRVDTLAQSSRRRRVTYVFENNQLVLSGSEDIRLPEGS